MEIKAFTLASLLSQHSDLLLPIGMASVLLLSVSLMATPWLLAKLPADYFSAPQTSVNRSGTQLLISVVKTLLGTVMIFAGFVMMFTPGPGLVLVVLGLALCEFSGKHRLMTSLVKRPSVLSTLNWFRKKAKKPPFESP